MKNVKLLFALIILTVKLTTAQNVGIGTITPNAKLHVVDTILSQVKIQSKDFRDTSRLILSNRNKDNQGTDFMITAMSESGLKFSTKSDLATNSNDSILSLLINGNTGIGTKNPTEKLDVNGNINVRGNLKMNGNSGTTGQVLVSNGATTAPTWQTTNYQIAFVAMGTSPAVSNFQVISPNVETPITIINNETYDPLNMYDAATGMATITVNGLYHISATVCYRSTASGSYSLTLNSSFNGTPQSPLRTVHHEVATGSPRISLSIDCDVYLYSGHSLQLFTNQTSAGTKSIFGSFYSWFNMHQIF